MARLILSGDGNSVSFRSAARFNEIRSGIADSEFYRLIQIFLRRNRNRTQALATEIKYTIPATAGGDARRSPGDSNGHRRIRPGVMHTVDSGLVHDFKLYGRAFASALRHAVPIAVSQAHPVETSHLPFAELFRHAADVGHEEISRRPAVIHRIVMDAVLGTRAHRAAPFRADRAVGIFPHQALEMVHPARLRIYARPEGIIVNGEKAPVEAAVAGDIRDIPREAGAVQDDAVPRNIRKLLKPCSIKAAELIGFIHVRLVENLEISVRIIAISLDDLCPHRPKVVHVLRTRRLARSPVSQHHTALAQRGVTRAGIRIPESRYSRLIDGQAHAIRPE